VYFEQRLNEAERMSVAKQPLPAKFSAGFTTERPKTWPETIKLIRGTYRQHQDQFKVE